MKPATRVSRSVAAHSQASAGAGNRVVLGLVCLLSQPPTVPAQVPSILQFQGRVLVASTPFNGPGSFKFALVDGSDAAVLWRNSADGNGDGQPDLGVSIPVGKGLYSVALGDGTLGNMAPIPVSVFSRPDVRLRVWFNDGLNGFEALVPDQRLTASAYALMAAAVPDGTITAAQLAPGTLVAGNLSGVLGPHQLPEDVAYRSTHLAGATNALIASLQATNAALSARIEALQTQVEAAAAGSAGPGSAFLSTDPTDAGFLARGLVRVGGLPAPGWNSGPAPGEPTARVGHLMVWTGSEIWVWGGYAGGGAYLNTGGRLSPQTETWAGISPIDAPGPVTEATAVWTGSEVLVWGGYGPQGLLNVGGAYRPEPQRWRPVSTEQAPSPRLGHLAVWTGQRMVVWGGSVVGGLSADGGSYDPATDSWSPLPTANVPEARWSTAAAWTGSRLILWGGQGVDGVLGTGASLPFSTGSAIPDVWEALPMAGAPTPRACHTGVWTGSAFLVWGGLSAGDSTLADGARFDPVTREWSPLSMVGAPEARFVHSAVWTGTEMLVYGGKRTTTGGSLNSGGAYNPVTDTWRPLSLAGNPLAREQVGAVWTGTHLAVFGGRAELQILGALQRLDPTPAWHFYRKP